MELDPHAAYVAKGYCDAVNDHKVWCFHPAGHAGQHEALRLMPDRTFIIGARWD